MGRGKEGQTHQVRTEEKRPFDEKCASLCYRLLSATKLIYNRQMPGGGRKTHEFPKGMPLPLLVVEIAFAVGIFILIVWFMKAGFHSWREGALLGVVVITSMYIRRQLIRFYENKGLAIPLRPRNPSN